MGPWLVIGGFLAAINLFVFIALRGRWGRIVPVLLLAAVGGTLAGNLVGERTGLELVRIGDFNVVAASVGAQLAMLAVTLLSALAPTRIEE